jgi:hypothetical protein
MSDTAPAIFDYAAVRPLSSLRAAARSRIETNESADGVRIVESLSGITNAKASIGFGIGVVGVIGAWIWQNWTYWWGESIIAGILILLIIAVILTIIDNTWRKTILEANAEQFSLTFRSLYTIRNYKWSREKVSSIDVYLGTDSAKTIELYELRIMTTTHAPARLFTGHPLPEMEKIAIALRKYCNTGASPLQS